MWNLNKCFGMKDKVVVVTGAASVIGLGISRFFASAGVSVAMLDVDRERGLMASEGLGGDRDFFFCDVTDSPSCLGAIESVVSNFGKVNILLNCAWVARRDDVVGLKERTGTSRLT